MQTHPAKRVSIIIEADMEQTLRAALNAARVTGFTVLPVLGGSGRSGNWSGGGQAANAGGMVNVICIVAPDKKDRLLEAIFSVVERNIGVVTVSDCEVLRAERF